MLSSTVESSNSSNDWNEREMPRRARRVTETREMSVSFSMTVPVARVNPVMASMADVLPAPFGTDQADDLPRAHREVDLVDGDDPAIANGEALDRQGAGRDALPFCRHFVLGSSNFIGA